MSPCYDTINLNATVDKGIKFDGSKFAVHTFTDADWSGCLITRKSTTDYIVFAAGGPIVCQSNKLQDMLY